MRRITFIVSVIVMVAAGCKMDGSHEISNLATAAVWGVSMVIAAMAFPRRLLVRFRKVIL